MAGWIRDRFGSLLDNALYEGVRLLILALVLPVLYAVWRFLTQQPLQWTVLIVFIALGLIAFALLGFGALKKKTDRLPQPVLPAVEPAMPIVPAQDLSYLADPAYDHFWQTPEERFRGRLDALIKTGQLLIEQWTTRLDYPERYRRENDSKNWLCEVGEFVEKHLTSEQTNEFTSSHGTAASPGKKYDFAMALTHAGTQPSSDDGSLAFEIFGKVKLLERFRSAPIPREESSEQTDGRNEGEVKPPDRLTKTLGRRLTEIEKGITGNSGNIALLESLNIEPEISKQIQNKPKQIEVVEPQLIEEAYSIDRDFSWPVFRELGIAIKQLNEGIQRNNNLFRSALSRELLEQIEGIRKLITRIEAEKTSHGESRQLKAQRDKLKNLLAKRERLDARRESPGFDIAEARRRNERFIAEVRADITRLENEQS